MFRLHLEIIGAAYGGGTVAQMLTGDVVVACLQEPVAIEGLVDGCLGVEVGWGVG